MRLFFHSIHDLGLPTIGHVVANSARRRRAQPAERAARTPAGPEVEPGALHAVAALGSGARFEFAQAALEVAFLADDVVRLTWEPGVAPVPYAVCDPLPWRAPAVTVADAPGGGRVLRGGSLEVEVGAHGEVAVQHPGASALWQAPPPVRRIASWKQRFVMRPGEHVFGLGEQAGPGDRRGRTFRLWNRDPGGSWGPTARAMYLSAPVLVATHDDGDTLSFFENSTHATVRLPADDGRADEGSLTFAGGQLRHYLMAGHVAQLLERYSDLTGRPALPPRWALGYHQSRWGYKRRRHVEGVLDGYRTAGVPLSAVHLDIDYMDGYRVFTIDGRRFPDMASLARRAAEQGVRIVTIVDPAVKVDDGYPLYRQAMDGGWFCRRPDGEVEVGVVWPGRAAFPDFTNPGTRQWWAEQYRVLLDAGIGGIWHDMNEPTSIALAGDPTLPLDTRHDFDGRGGDHGEGHNVYGLLMNRAAAEGMRRARPERRPWIVSRSGWAGSQRYAWNWTGDVETTWAGLRQQMATVMGLGLSGIAYSGPDIGGFSGVPDEELYLRWMQMSVLLPFCRTHSVVGTPPREPWRFTEPVRTLIGSWIRLRYRLLPYLYTLAHDASATGAPLVRPLWWPTAAAGLAGVEDAYLLGNDLLVAPVTEAGARRRDVPLPPGQWSSWWRPDGGIVHGDGHAPAPIDAPLGRIPVLVRAGTVLPLDDGWADASPGACALDGDDGLGRVATPPELAPDHAPHLLAFHCWPLLGEARGIAVDDAGDGDGPVRRDRLSLSGATAGGSAVFGWERSGGYRPPERVRVVLHGFEAEGAQADGVEVAVRGGAVECGAFDELQLHGLRAVTAAEQGR